jgi:uncharacterized membrane protein YkvA (DUF1232 family)
LRSYISRFRRLFLGVATEIYALSLALRDPHASWGARLVALAFAFYILNPIDIIPEAIPFVGILDDLMAVPLAYFVVSKMVPTQLLESAHRAAAESNAGERIWRVFLIALGVLCLIWIVAFVGLGITIWRAVG